MSALRSIIQPYAARILSSNQVLAGRRVIHRVKRRLKGADRQAEVYLRINDPYSYLLVQVLADFQQRYDLKVRFRTILSLRDDMYPEPEMWHANAAMEAVLLARLYKLQFPEMPTERSAAETEHYTALLAEQENHSSPDWPLICTMFGEYWSGNPATETLKQLPAEQIRQNEKVLLDNGHYMSAMIHYEGEWYWGIDRLEHLETRLNEDGAAEGEASVLFNKTWSGLCQSPALSQPSPDAGKLILYFSIRSPYSHIGLEQAIRLADHYKLDLEIKPVLPMIMRGLSVPPTKKMYIFHDTKREAQKLGIDYGFVADPLGEGVVRCYALFRYACDEGREKEYLLAYARAVNAMGIRSETDSGLRKIVLNAGLSWEKAREILSESDWRESWQGWAEANREEMIAQGQWGVPSLRYRDTTLWGQDRVVFAEQAVLKDLGRL